MKNLYPLVLLVLLFSNCSRQETFNKNQGNAINVMIGDESYVAKYGKMPDENTPEHQRIKIHLEYAEQQLRAKDDSHLTTAEQISRKNILDLLKEYIVAGNFPKNYDMKGERRPCFLDKDGNICAVGYLVEQTHSLALACKINSIYKYDLIKNMDMPELNSWVATSGLTKDEFALIQPSYSYKEQPFIYSENVATPAVAQLSAFNVVLICINGKQIGDGRTSNLAPLLGITSGALNIGYSTILLANSSNPISYFGMLTGTAALVTSSANLIFKKKLEHNNLSLSSKRFITPDGKHIPGITLTYRF